jgi:hypothetical protein
MQKHEAVDEVKSIMIRLGQGASGWDGPDTSLQTIQDRLQCDDPT